MWLAGIISQDGEQHAFRQIVERNKLSVLNLCLRFTNNREDAEDLAQEVFMRIFEAAPRYKVQASFSTWLYRITVNLCLNHQRRKKIIQFFSLNHKSNSNHYAEYKAPEFTDDDRPDTDLEKRETQHIVQNAIQSLPENQKVVTILHRYHDLSYKEIADILDTTVSSVESRLHRAKQNLKKRLAVLITEIS